MWIIMPKSCHNCAHVMTAQLSWHVQICDLIESSEMKLELKEFSQDFDYKLVNSLWNGPRDTIGTSRTIDSFNHVTITAIASKLLPLICIYKLVLIPDDIIIEWSAVTGLLVLDQDSIPLPRAAINGQILSRDLWLMFSHWGMITSAWPG